MVCRKMLTSPRNIIFRVGAPTLVRRVFAVVVASATLWVGACGDGSTDPAGFQLSIQSATSLAAGQVGVAYSQTLAATGGDGNYEWATFNSTTLPAGLSLNGGTGEISGTPTALGTTNFEVEVTSAGLTASKALAITINVPPPLLPLVVMDPFDTPGLPGWTVYNGIMDAQSGDIRAVDDPTGLGLALATRTAESFAPDQYSSGEIALGINPAAFVQVFVRRQSDTRARYGFSHDGNDWYIKYDGVSLTDVLARVPAPGVFPVGGDELRIEIKGFDITGYYNGVPVIAVTDVAQYIPGTGEPGIVGAIPLAVLPTPLFSAWEGGDL